MHIEIIAAGVTPEPPHAYDVPFDVRSRELLPPARTDISDARKNEESQCVRQRRRKDSDPRSAGRCTKFSFDRRACTALRIGRHSTRMGGINTSIGYGRALLSLRVAPMTRAEIGSCLDAVADLRIRVFAEFPYLYDGDMEYERRYLATYRESERSVIVGAWDGDRLVGASTGTPMEDHADGFTAGFEDHSIDVTSVFYCAESVLLPEYRGRGIGGQFFDYREAHARALGRDWSTFCAVMRPENHPAKPMGYVPHDGFWTKRGYAKLPGAIAHFSWKDHGDVQETQKPLQFWIRSLKEPSS